MLHTSSQTIAKYVATIMVSHERQSERETENKKREFPWKIDSVFGNFMHLTRSRILHGKLIIIESKACQTAFEWWKTDIKNLCHFKVSCSNAQAQKKCGYHFLDLIPTW